MKLSLFLPFFYFMTAPPPLADSGDALRQKPPSPLSHYADSFWADLPPNSMPSLFNLIIQDAKISCLFIETCRERCEEKSEKKLHEMILCSGK